MGSLHAANLASMPPVELVHVSDEREEVARSLAATLGAACSTDPGEVVSDPRVDAIVIATPTSTHSALISAAASGGKHVFCEKPLGCTPREHRDAIAAANDAGVCLQVGFHRRFDPDWVAARERIAAGELGEVYLFHTTLREREPPSREYIESAGSFFADFTIHDLDIARWLVGEVSEISAFTAGLSDPLFRESDHPDQAIIVVRFACGALGTIDNSRTARYGYECSTEVVGSHATVRIGRNQQRHDVQWLSEAGVRVDHIREFAERYYIAYYSELEGFARAVLASEPVAVSGEDAFEAFRLATDAQRSLELRRPVTHAGIEMEAESVSRAGRCDSA